MANMHGFAREVTDLINRYSLESLSDTPDFILAQYVARCLEAYAEAMQAREQWYGRSVGQKTAEAPTRTIEGLTPDEERLRQALGAGQTLPAPYGQGWLEHPPPGA